MSTDERKGTILFGIPEPAGRRLPKRKAPVAPDNRSISLAVEIPRYRGAVVLKKRTVAAKQNFAPQTNPGRSLLLLLLTHLAYALEQQ
jgi:hypothetical protein